MGKKNRQNKSDNTNKRRSEEDLLVSSLLEKTSKLNGGNAKESWNEHLEIRQLLGKIQKLQDTTSESSNDRSMFLPTFLKWLSENGAEFEKVTVFSDPDNICGVKASEELQEGEKIMKIPRKLILASDYSVSTFLGQIIKSDRMLQLMPNVVLALKLLFECKKKNSFWKPYIDILPTTFTTPLFFTVEEIEILRGSQILDNTLNLYKSIARQYAYLHGVFKKIPKTDEIEDLANFTFSEYRWAVSIVMTRQNQIPSSEETGSHLALIPLLDMCNHTDGQITTDYDVENDSCICFSLNSTKPDEQVFIFYGPRSNSDLFLHCGFYYDDNKYDDIHLKLGISSSDCQKTEKTQLLSKIAINMKNIAVNRNEFPLTKELLAFLRIFCIDKDEGNQLLSESHEKLSNILLDQSSRVSKRNEEKVWNFLEMRCTLILRQYSTTIEEDDARLKSTELTKNSELAIRYCRGEKRLLQNVVLFCQARKDGMINQE